MLELAPIPSHKIPSHADEKREGENCKKEIETDKNTTVDIPDDPELHEDTEIAALLVAAKAEAGPVTISGDNDDDHHHHGDGAADASKRCELYCTYCDPVCGWCDFCGRGYN